VQQHTVSHTPFVQQHTASHTPFVLQHIGSMRGSMLIHDGRVLIRHSAVFTKQDRFTKQSIYAKQLYIDQTFRPIHTNVDSKHK